MDDILNAKIKEEELVDKSNISDFIANSDLDKKIATVATKGKLKSEQDKLVKLQKFDASYFRGKSNFEDDGTQSSLMFQPVYKYFKMTANRDLMHAGVFYYLMVIGLVKT